VYGSMVKVTFTLDDETVEAIRASPSGSASRKAWWSVKPWPRMRCRKKN
jgi:hypothetical protein